VLLPRIEFLPEERSSMLAHLSAAMTSHYCCSTWQGLPGGSTGFISSYALAKVVSPLLLCLGCFFVEHFFGLGKLSWLWPLTTLHLSGWF
jgi:hypothetical protein